MQHANAPLTPQGRLRLVLLVEEEGFTLQAAADTCNVAKWTERAPDIAARLSDTPPASLGPLFLPTGAGTQALRSWR